MKDTHIIVFEGIIGTGKSTTLKMVTEELQTHGYSVYVVDECVDSWVEDGLLQKFYADPVRYSYHFQTKAFIDKVKMFVNATQYIGKVDFIFTERGVVSDYIFASLLHENKSMDDMEFKHYNEWYNFIKRMVPDEFAECKTLYLRNDPHTAMGRVRQRDRSGESGISDEYQTQLYDLHEKYFNNDKTCIWDSSKNIFEKENLNELVKALLKFIYN